MFSDHVTVSSDKVEGGAICTIVIIKMWKWLFGKNDNTTRKEEDQDKDKLLKGQ